MTPAAAYVEQGLAAADQVFGPGRHGAGESRDSAGDVPAGGRAAARADFDRAGVGRRSDVRNVQPAGGRRERGGAPGRCTRAARWCMNRTTASPRRRSSAIDLDAVRADAVGITSRDEFYDLMAERGLVYGPTFQVLDDLHRGAEEAAIEVRAAGIGRPRGSRDIICIRRWATRCCNRWRAPCRWKRTARSVRSRTCRSAFAAFASCGRSTISRSRCSRTRCARRAIRAPARSASRRTCCLVNAEGEVLVALEGVEVQRLGRSGGADAAVDTSRGCIASPGSRAKSLRQARQRGTATDDRRVADLCRFARRRRASWPISLRAARQVERAGRAWQRVPVPRRAAAANGKPARHPAATIDPLDETHYRAAAGRSVCRQAAACARASCICGRSIFRSETIWIAAAASWARRARCNWCGRWRGRRCRRRRRCGSSRAVRKPVDGDCDQRRSPSSSRRCWAWAAWRRWSCPICGRGWSISIRRASSNTRAKRPPLLRTN